MGPDDSEAAFRDGRYSIEEMDGVAEETCLAKEIPSQDIWRSGLRTDDATFEKPDACKGAL